MARWLKEAITVEERTEIDEQVRSVVENSLADIESRGDEAVREMSAKFDGWSPEAFRMSEADIEACVNQLSARSLKTFSLPSNRSVILRKFKSPPCKM